MQSRSGSRKKPRQQNYLAHSLGSFSIKESVPGCIWGPVQWTRTATLLSGREPLFFIFQPSWWLSKPKSFGPFTLAGLNALILFDLLYIIWSIICYLVYYILFGLILILSLILFHYSASTSAANSLLQWKAKWLFTFGLNKGVYFGALWCGGHV